jgi:hypothetical protein
MIAFSADKIHSAADDAIAACAKELGVANG